MSSVLHAVIGFIFGDFTQEELKKFVLMGCMFGLIIGSYWTLRIIKNAVFCIFAGPDLLPWAKTISLICLIPIIMIYTQLLEIYSRKTMLYLLPIAYTLITMIFAGLMFFGPGVTECVAHGSISHITLAFAYYVFVESYGSLVVALFWAFASEITMPDSAKRGFPLVVAIGQLGAIFGPVVIARLPQWFGMTTSALPLCAVAVMTALIIPVVYYFFRVTPQVLLQSYGGVAAHESTEEPGFFEGLRLLLKHGYLSGIFVSVFAFEFIATIFDFNFQSAAFLHFGNTPEYFAYLGDFGGLVNIVTLVCLLLGVSNITRLLGVGRTLVLIPIIIFGALIGFLTMNSLNFLLGLMVGSKALNYALNGPAQKQLYIPTTHDTRFKAQAWIETFGSRLAKQSGGMLNLMKQMFGEARYLMACNYVGFSLVSVWFFTALYLGKKHRDAISKDELIC